MRSLLDDLRYGLEEMLRAPQASSRSAVWLLAGVVLGTALGHWADAAIDALDPLALSEPGAAPAATSARVPAARVLGHEAESRLRCLVGHPTCQSTPTPSPCVLERVAPRDS